MTIFDLEDLKLDIGCGDGNSAGNGFNLEKISRFFGPMDSDFQTGSGPHDRDGNGYGSRFN